MRSCLKPVVFLTASSMVRMYSPAEDVKTYGASSKKMPSTAMPLESADQPAYVVTSARTSEMLRVA